MKTPRNSKKDLKPEETNGTAKKNQIELTFSDAKPIEGKVDPKDMLEVNFDGPFGAPATNIFRAEHAVLGMYFFFVMFFIHLKYSFNFHVCPSFHPWSVRNFVCPKDNSKFNW